MNASTKQFPTTKAEFDGPAAWTANAKIDNSGRRATSGNCAVRIFATCVDWRFPSGERERLDLLRSVLSSAPSAECGEATLHALPAAFFFAPEHIDRLRERLIAILSEHLAPSATVAFGVDLSTAFADQYVWVAQWQGNRVVLHEVRRAHTELHARKFQVGEVLAAFFVCGEVAGSKSENNGPFCRKELLRDPVTQLSDCQLLVDVAHAFIRGTVLAEVTASQRMVHQRALEAFAKRGAAVLTHHHDGDMTANRAKAWSQSTWVVFNGGAWLEESAVTAINA